MSGPAPCHEIISGYTAPWFGAIIAESCPRSSSISRYPAATERRRQKVFATRTAFTITHCSNLPDVRSGASADLFILDQHVCGQNQISTLATAMSALAQ